MIDYSVYMLSNRMDEKAEPKAYAKAQMRADVFQQVCGAHRYPQWCLLMRNGAWRNHRHVRVPGRDAARR